jgi:hypothetical protein
MAPNKGCHFLIVRYVFNESETIFAIPNAKIVETGEEVLRSVAS